MHAGFDRSAAVILATLTRAAFTRAAAIRLDGMTEDLSPAAHAQAIAAARQRLLTFVQRCTDGDWRAASVDGDPRPIGVIADHVAGHLQSSGDALIALVAGLEPGQLDLDDMRVRRLAIIAARHTDKHRAEIEAALAAAA